MGPKLFIFSLLVLKTIIDSTNSYPQQTTLFEILDTIIKDPEFMALPDYEQLEVLQTVYNILHDSYKERLEKKTINDNYILAKLVA
jgi:hypothetical protein